MKKILIIHNILWSHYKAVVFSELDSLIKNSGDELMVLHIAPKGAAQKNLGDADVQLHKYNYKLLFSDDYEKISNFKKSVVLCNEVYNYKPDIIIQPGFGEIPFWASLCFAKILKIPSILSCDSTAEDRPSIWFKNILKKIYVKNCVAGYSYGQKSKEYLLSLGMQPEKVFYRSQAAPNAQIREIYDSAYANRQPSIISRGFKPHNFIFVGRLTKIKNIDNLIKAFTLLKKNNVMVKNWGLIIVGDGPQRNELVELTDNLRVDDVYFVGGKSWREVPEFYALADVHILPSISEPWGVVVNEAMVCGLPVLVSKRCGAAFELVKEDCNGLTFDPNSLDELVMKMSFFVSNQDRLLDMGNCSREIIEQFSPKNSARMMLNAISIIFNRD